MELTNVVREYISAQNAERPMGRELSALTCRNYLETATVYSRHLRRRAAVDDLESGKISEFLKAELEAGRSPYTVKGRRNCLLIHWRFAHARGWASRPCGGVRPIHCPPLAINGYSFEEMERLLAHAATLCGVLRLTGVKKSIYWDSFLRTDWEVGMRIGDMIRVELPHFDSSGWLWCYETKTHKAGWRRLRPSTSESIASCIAANPHRKLIWPGYTRKNICRAFTELAAAAGVKGTSKYIRSGGSSECDRQNPGSGWQHLRHSSPVVWQNHYKVDKIVDQDKPLPPELGRAG